MQICRSPEPDTITLPLLRTPSRVFFDKAIQAKVMVTALM
jgi:hypothetical protein